MEIGQPYNPRKLFFGIFVPEWLLERSEISQGAKLCFGVLGRASNDEGAAAIDGESVGVQLGTSHRQARRYLAELEAEGLIVSEQRGLGLPNLYRFLWHAWVDAAPVRETPRKGRSVSKPEWTDVSRQERTYLSTPERKDVSTPSFTSQSTTTETPNRARVRAAAAELSEPERGTPDPYQEASELLHECQDVLYAFTGAEVTGRQAEEFRSQVAAHLRNGREVDRSLLEEATTRAEDAFRENGQGRRGVGWVLNALRDLLTEAHEPKAPPVKEASAIPPWGPQTCPEHLKKYYPSPWEGDIWIPKRPPNS